MLPGVRFGCDMVSQDVFFVCEVSLESDCAFEASLDSKAVKMMVRVVMLAEKGMVNILYITKLFSGMVKVEGGLSVPLEEH